MNHLAPGDCAAWFSALTNKITFVTVLTTNEALVEHDVLYTRPDDDVDVMDVSSNEFNDSNVGDILIWRSD